MSAATSPDDFNIVHPGHYAEHGYPHDIWTRLRAESPVHWWEQDEGPAFWAITKHADITAISKQPELFISNPRTVVSHVPELDQSAFNFPPTLIQLDPPKHGIFRHLVSKRFTPRALKKIHDPIEQIGKEIVDALVKDKDYGECDFVKEVSAPLPIAVIAWLLGVPKSDWKLLFDWTNRIIGAGDPEFQDEGKTSAETATGAMTELFTYFAKMVEEKKKKPADDLVTVFTQVEVDGKKLELMDVLAWCMIIVIAGNETTRNGTSGGMLAFIEHPTSFESSSKSPGCCPGRWRRWCAGHRRSSILPGPRRPTPNSAVTRSERARSWACSTVRRTATRMSSTTPSRFGSIATRTATWGSVWGSTSASARTSRVSKWRWPTSTCCRASRRSNSPARSCACIRRSWAA